MEPDVETPSSCTLSPLAISPAQKFKGEILNPALSVSRSEGDDGRCRGPVVAHVAAARLRRHAHLVPLRIPLRVRACALHVFPLSVVIALPPLISNSCLFGAVTVMTQGGQ